MAQAPTMPTICPRCGERVAAGAKLRAIPQPPGHAAAWKLTHKRDDGRGPGCAAVITEYIGAGGAPAAGAGNDLTVRADGRAVARAG